MSKIRIISFASIVLLVSVSIFACGCGKKDNAGSLTTPAGTASILTKPLPVIVSVNDTTSGMQDNYYAILAITLKNQGSTGTVVINASLTQGTQTQTNQMITNVEANSTQVINLVFPLKWQGGEWSQNVTVTVP